MKARARLISTATAGSAARLMGRSAGRARALPSGVSVMASATDETGVHRYLYVAPETPQTLVWLVPQVGIDYTIESNTNWHII